MEEDPLSICYCGWGYNRPMIRCCRCKHWYHYDCVNVTRRILEDASHWYCFECIDFKPNSDSDDNYDFEADVKRIKQMNEETRNHVNRMLEDTKFSRNSVLSMSVEEVTRSICCIEQRLLIEDDSHLIHDTKLASNLINQKYKLDRKNRLVILNSNPLMRGFLVDIERLSLYKQPFSINSYLVSKESNRRSRITITADQNWMCYGRQYLMDNIIPRKCIPINADVRTFNWQMFAATQQKLAGRLFDVIMMDPPWQLTTDNPYRGVTIQYQQLNDKYISALPLSTIQKDGLLFMWVINSKYRIALKMLENWGYTFVCDLVWVKKSARGYIAQGNGFYLRHSKEICFVAKKGSLSRVDKQKLAMIDDVILARRKGQSQKPNEIYDIIENLVPNGYYLEIFGRLNNLRDNWVTIGNEI